MEQATKWTGLDLIPGMSEHIENTINAFNYPRWEVAECHEFPSGSMAAEYRGTWRGAELSVWWFAYGMVVAKAKDGDLAVEFDSYDITTRSAFNIIVKRVVRALDAAAEQV